MQPIILIAYYTASLSKHQQNSYLTTTFYFAHFWANALRHISDILQDGDILTNPVTFKRIQQTALCFDIPIKTTIF